MVANDSHDCRAVGRCDARAKTSCTTESLNDIIQLYEALKKVRAWEDVSSYVFLEKLLWKRRFLSAQGKCSKIIDRAEGNHAV